MTNEKRTCLRFPGDLYEEIRAVAKEMRVSPSEAMRKSMAVGVRVLSLRLVARAMKAKLRAGRGRSARSARTAGRRA